jgi:hypothetical protein
MNKLLLPLITLIFLVSCKKETEDPPAPEVEQLNPDDFIGTVWELQEFYYNDSALKIGFNPRPDGNILVGRTYLKFMANGDLYMVENLDSAEFKLIPPGVSSLLVQRIIDIRFAMNSDGYNYSDFDSKQAKYRYVWSIVNNTLRIRETHFLFNLNVEIGANFFNAFVRDNGIMYIELPVTRRNLAAITKEELKTRGVLLKKFEQVEAIKGIFLVDSYVRNE